MRRTDTTPKPQGLRILVVGESGPGSELISSLLEFQGHEVRIAQDALDAIRLAFEFVPHVAFIDLQVVTKNEFELPRALRSLHEARNCKFIVTAGGVGSHDLRALKRAGLSHLLRRPINLESVARAVDEANAPPFLLS